MAELNSKPGAFTPDSSPPGARTLNEIRDNLTRAVRGGDNVDVRYLGDRIGISAQNINPQLGAQHNYIQQFIVVEEEADTLICVPLEPMIDNPGNIYSFTKLGPYKFDPDFASYYPLSNDQSLFNQFKVRVAKPFYLQQTPWKDKSIPNLNSVQPSTMSFQYIEGSSWYRETLIQIAPPLQQFPADYYVFLQRIVPSYFPGDIITAARILSGYQDYLPPGNQLAPGFPPVSWMDLNTAGRIWFPAWDAAPRWGVVQLHSGFVSVDLSLAYPGVGANSYGVTPGNEGTGPGEVSGPNIHITPLSGGQTASSPGIYVVNRGINFTGTFTITSVTPSIPALTIPITVTIPENLLIGEGIVDTYYGPTSFFVFSTGFTVTATNLTPVPSEINVNDNSYVMWSIQP